MRDEALQRLLAAGPELEWSDWAMPAAGLGAVVELARGRAEIVECGSGVSTIVLARLAREQGGRLRSLEHDAGWAELIRARLAVERLEPRASVVHAPLAPHPLARDGDEWYAPEALAELPPDGIELLLVDGPPAGEPEIERRRYPALPALLPRLAADAIVVLDDAARPGERWVLDRWKAETPYQFTEGPGGIAIGRRGTYGRGYATRPRPPQPPAQR